MLEIPFTIARAMFFQSFSYCKNYRMEPIQFFGISPNAFVAVGATVNFVDAHIVSRMIAQVPDDIIDLIEYVRVPKGEGVAHEYMQKI